uniref:Uncharacterized protein n=1 Tax=Fundulus heteroclitus TaxID=8078 RepID=A0A3Q2QWT0_FUNHE
MLLQVIWLKVLLFLQVRMAKVKQVGLLAAGCQPWNKDVCAASGDRFAYCATLAIYIYQLDQQYNEFKLRSIMSEHKKTITAISWCPDNPDLFASASADNLLIIWNVAEKKAAARLDNTKGESPSPAAGPLTRLSPACPPQGSPSPSAGAGTRRTEWRSSPSEVRSTSGTTEVLTRESRCTKRPTPSCRTSVCSAGTPPRKASWCSGTQTGACRCSSQGVKARSTSCVQRRWRGRTKRTQSAPWSGTLCPPTTYWCRTSTTASGWWTARVWPASRPSASPRLLRPSSVWPGSPRPRACSSPEVKRGASWCVGLSVEAFSRLNGTENAGM